MVYIEVDHLTPHLRRNAGTGTQMVGVQPLAPGLSQPRHKHFFQGEQGIGG